MTDKELEAIYSAGNAVSSSAALRAVFEAGRLSAVVPEVKIVPKVVKSVRKYKKKK